MRKLVIGIVALGVLGAGAYAGVDHFANSKVKERAEIFAQQMRRQMRTFTYSEARVRTLSQSIELTDVFMETKKGEKLRIDSVVVRDFEWRLKGTPRHADLVFKGVEFSTPDGKIAGPMKRFGLDGRKSDHSLSYRYDEQDRTLELKEYKIEAKDFGTLIFRVKFGNVPQDVADRALRNPADLSTAFSAAASVSLAYASLSIRDRGGVDRTIRHMAAHNNLSEAEMKKRILESLEAEKRRVVFPVQGRIVEALAALVRKPGGEIGVSAEPQPPLALMEAATSFMASPLSLERRLNLSVLSR
jgi:hypothetical protein